MSGHDDGHGGRPDRDGGGLGAALVGFLILWIVLKDGAGPAAHAVAREFTSGVPFVDLPFDLAWWVLDHTAGDIYREMLGKDDER